MIVDDRLENPDVRFENRFARGQVWYWEDPVYQNKGKSIAVDRDEYRLRYSRYVLIIQEPDLIVKNSVLIAPITSTDSRREDVEIWIDMKQLSYIRIEKIMPVCIQSLTRYICTLSDETMDYVDAMIMKLMLPSIYNHMKNADIKEGYKYNRNRCLPTNEELSEIKDWFNNNVIYDKTQSLSLQVMYERYNADNPKRFTLYQFITAINQVAIDGNAQHRMLTLPNFKLVSKEKVQEKPIPKENKSNTENVKNTHGKYKIEADWTEAERHQYILDYESMTHRGMAKKYNISTSSVYRIFNRIMQMEEDNKEKEREREKVKEKKEKTVNENIKKHTKDPRWVQSIKDKSAGLHNLRKSVLRLEYLIRMEFNKINTFEDIMSTDTFYGKDKKNFYIDLSGEIRKSIIRFASIIVMPNTNSSTDDYKSSPVMNSAQAYMYNIFIYMDKKSNHILNNIISLDELLKSIKNQSKNVGLSIEWGECLKELIIKDLGINEMRADEIIHKLDRYYIH